MKRGDLGRDYEAGEVVVRQGETGDSMYVVLEGLVEILREEGGRECSLSVIGAGDFFGEMALFARDPRSATARAKVATRLLTIDRKGFLKWVHQDPSLVFRILQKMADRIRNLNEEVERLRRR